MAAPCLKGDCETVGTVQLHVRVQDLQGPSGDQVARRCGLGRAQFRRANFARVVSIPENSKQ